MQTHRTCGPGPGPLRRPAVDRPGRLRPPGRASGAFRRLPGASGSGLMCCALLVCMACGGCGRSTVPAPHTGLTPPLRAGREAPGGTSDPRRAPSDLPPIHLESIQCAAFSPDGKFLLTGYDISASPPEPDPRPFLRLWDVDTGRQVRVLEGHTDRVRSVAFLPDSRRAISASRDGTWKLWDVTTGRTLWTVPAAYGGVGPAIPADGKSAWGCTLSDVSLGRLAVRGLDRGEIVRTFEGDIISPAAVAVSPDGEHALTVPGFGRRGGTISLWGQASDRMLTSLGTGPDWGPPAAFSPDGRLAITGGSRKVEPSCEIVLWDVRRRRELRRFPPSEYGYVSATFTPDGRYLLAGRLDSTLVRWEVTTGREVWSAKLAEGDIGASAYAFSADGKLAFPVFALDPRAKRPELWDLTSGKLLRALEVPGP